MTHSLEKLPTRPLLVIVAEFCLLKLDDGGEGPKWSLVMVSILPAYLTREKSEENEHLK